MTVTPQTNTSLKAIAELIAEHDNFVICGHVSPDGDCLGSQLALWHALRAVGKNATCILVKDEPIDPSLTFMPGTEEMVPAKSFQGDASVFIGVDVPTRERIEADACAILDRCSLSITIDHHANETTMCDYVYVDPDVASASMIVWEIAKLINEGWPPAECALCAYTGLITDTGGFRFQNSDAQAFKAASELVAYGVDPAFAAACAFQNRSLTSLKLEEIVIGRLRLREGGAVALSWVTISDMERLGAAKSDTEPLIDTLRSIHGVRIACILREQDGKIRGSLRSKDETDVSTLARQLNGGGHKAAAGFTLDMNLEEAVKLLEVKLHELVGSQEA